MATPGLEVRRVRPDELAAVGEITVAAYSAYTLGPDDPYLERLGDAAARDREAEVWVAVAADGTLLGSVTLCPPGSPWRELSRAGEGEFRMLSVDPARQCRGAGGALVALCVDRARRDGNDAVVISSLREMATAHRLYGRLGFERIPERDWEPVPGVHLVCFRLDLRGASDG